MKFLKTQSTSSNILRTETDEKKLPELKGHLKPKLSEKISANDQNPSIFKDHKKSKLEEKQSQITENIRKYACQLEN